MESLFFALWSFFLNNPHQGESYMIPVPYGIEIYEQAEKYSNVSPADLATVIVAEHGGGYPYPADSRECKNKKVWSDKKQKKVKRCKRKKGGQIHYIAWGLMQISKGEIKKYNKTHGTSYTNKRLPFMRRYLPSFIFTEPATTVMDWRTNIEVGAFTISEIKRRHTTKKRCKKKIAQHTTILQEDGSLGVKTTYRDPHHNWHAHYRCAVKIRDAIVWDEEDQRWEHACKTSYRVRLVKKFSKWGRSWGDFQTAMKKIEPKEKPLVTSAIQSPEENPKENPPKDANRKKKRRFLNLISH